MSNFKNIDAYISYRVIDPGHSLWRNIGIYQRNLENAKESPVLFNRMYGKDCMNCHTFLNNNTDNMVISIRSKQFGSSAIITKNGKAFKIGTKFGYTCWHPSEEMITYSINKVRQFYHSTRTVVRDVIDLASALCYYKVKTKQAWMTG